MIIHKSTGMGTLYEQLLTMRNRVIAARIHTQVEHLFAWTTRLALRTGSRELHPRHPLSQAVAAALSRSIK